jgi:hypothetical protein
MTKYHDNRQITVLIFRISNVQILANSDSGCSKKADLLWRYRWYGNPVCGILAGVDGPYCINWYGNPVCGILAGVDGPYCINWYGNPVCGILAEVDGPYCINY